MAREFSEALIHSNESRPFMARSRIAPTANVSIVCLVLNGAVLNDRLREIIEAETRYIRS